MHVCLCVDLSHPDWFPYSLSESLGTTDREVVEAETESDNGEGISRQGRQGSKTRVQSFMAVCDVFLQVGCGVEHQVD